MATATEALTRVAMRADDRVRLGLVVGVAFAVLALLALGAPGPRIFPDEIIYMDAAASLADGDSPTVRERDYGYGPVYPLLIAPIVALTDRETAFVVAQILNALAFALVAVPAFALALRVASAGWSLVAAALSVAVPSGVYASGILTESVGYLAFTMALLAIVRVVERPTVGRQLAACAVVGLAAGVRTQFVLLAIVLGTAIVAAMLALPAARRPPLRSFWPTAGVFGAGLLVVAALLAGGRSPADLLGDYGVLWSSYDVGVVARSVREHVSLLVLYVAVVPFIVAPVELGRWYRAARDGSRSYAAMLASFVAANLVTLLVVAVFAVNEHANGFLHDRSFFYVSPLWFAALAGWLGGGLQRPALLLGAAAATAAVLVAALPYSYVHAILWEMLALEPWQFVERGNPNGSPFSGREAMVGFVLVAAAAAAFVPRASRWVLVAVVGGMLLFAGSLAWGHARNGAAETDADVFGTGLQRAWVDATLRPGGRALLLTVPSRCRQSLHTKAMRLTEFFNDAPAGGAYVGVFDPLAPPSQRAIWLHGVLVDAATGEPLEAEYVVVRGGVALRGERLATGTRAPLAVWDVGGAVRLARPIGSLPCA